MTKLRNSLVLYGSYERISLVLQLLWAFFCDVTFSQSFFLKKVFCLEKEGVTVDHVDAVVDESYFENESSSNSSWEFCNQTTLPRSEVVFFVQRFYCITANITLYCSINRFKTKLWRNFDIVKLNWILFFTKSKTMKKVISTRELYLYIKIELKLEVKFKNYVNLEFLNSLANCLLITDDSYKEIYNDKDFVKSATAGRHENINVIYIKHNRYQKQVVSYKRIENNTHHIVQIRPRYSTSRIFMRTVRPW